MFIVPPIPFDAIAEGLSQAEINRRIAEQRAAEFKQQWNWNVSKDAGVIDIAPEDIRFVEDTEAKK